MSMIDKGRGRGPANGLPPVKKAVVVVPTYNEADNIGPLIPLILERDERLSVLVVTGTAAYAGLIYGLDAVYFRRTLRLFAGRG